VSKLILTLIVGVFLGAFAMEMFARDRPGRFTRKLAQAWERTKTAAREFRDEFEDAYAASEG
jgi:uncharacterized membrane-anchored protein YhcB (DUF1043 family)